MAERVRVAVAGCGLIGESWAALCLAHGHDVSAWDPAPAVRARFAERLERPLAQLAELGADQARRGRLTVCEGLADAVADAGLVQENAPESVPLKRGLYAGIEAAAGAEAIIASSTSALTWSDLSPGLARPGRFVTAHPFNPPHLVPLVELYGIDPAVLDRAEAFYRGLGRHPVRLKKDAVGHIANRLASALYREAVNLVAEGIADVAAVDEALEQGPGLRWSVLGAHRAYHLGGGEGGLRHYLDHLGPSQARRWASLGTPELTPALCDRLVAQMDEATGGRPVAELEAERDAALIRALKAR